MASSPYAQMLAQLRYYYRDARIHERVSEKRLLELHEELRWIRQQEAKANT